MRRITREGFDDLWPRLVRVIGVLLGLAEWTTSQTFGDEPSTAVLTFAGLLVTLPTVLAKKKGDDD